MRRHTLVLMLALVSLAAPASALAEEDAKTKRFKGTDSGMFVITGMDPGGGGIDTQETTTGTASGGIGRYTLVASEHVNLTTFAVTHGSWTLTASKGTLSGSYSGFASAPNALMEITYQVVGPIGGGTGRFAGARGTAAFDGVANLGTGALSETFSGVLDLPGDDGQL
jgi:hypothetical protein